MPRFLPAAIVATAGLAASHASATWSIILIDTRTGEIAVGSATCLTGFDLRANTPVLITGVGAATAQSAVDSTGLNRQFIRDGIATGASLNDILAGLAARDLAHQSRQYGMADLAPDTLTFTGAGASDWAGGVTGSFEYTHAGQTGTIIYAVQGNILTGSPVVDEAVDAMISTPGDLAEKLMAGMEAAQVFGGDGRCSCLTGPADSCGSPPAGFDPLTDKSADIGYMLIARAGDANGALANYDLEPAAIDAVLADAPLLDPAAIRDLLVIGNDNLWLVPNRSLPNGLIVLGEPQLITSLPARAGGITRGDLTGDGIDDLLITSPAGLSAMFLPGLGNNQFDTPQTFTFDTAPQQVALLDLNSDNILDAAIVGANATGGEINLLLSDGLGGLIQAVPFDTGGQAFGIATYQQPGRPRPDLAVSLSSENAVAIFQSDGGGGLVRTTSIPVGNAARTVASADFDQDGREDLAVANRDDNSVAVLFNTATGFSRVDLPAAGQARQVRVGHLNEDNLPDLAILARPGEPTRTWTANPGRTFSQGDDAHPTGGRSFTLFDLNADGLGDLVNYDAGAGITVNTNNGRVNAGPRFPVSGGQATGDYFMTFNVPFTVKADPDPVLTLRDSFDAWRTDLVNRPDAVTTEKSFAADRLPADGTSTTVLTIDLRDWTDSTVSIPVSAEVFHAPGSDGIGAVTAIDDLGNGRLAVTITAGTRVGTDEYLVRLDDGTRGVVLMPNPTLRFVAASADFNGDGVVDPADFLAYLDAFVAGDPRADLNGDGILDSDDFFFFLDLYEGVRTGG